MPEAKKKRRRLSGSQRRLRRAQYADVTLQGVSCLRCGDTDPPYWAKTGWTRGGRRWAICLACIHANTDRPDVTSRDKRKH